MARGRTAETPDDIPAKGWKDILFRVKDELGEDRVGLIAAGVAFYGLLALFPAITAILAVGGLLIAPGEIVEQIGAMQGIVPEAAMNIIMDQATEIAGSRDGGLGLTALLGIVLAIYSASKGMSSLMDGMNVAYDEEEERGFFRLKLETIGLTLLLIFGLIIGVGAMIALPSFLNFVTWGVLAEALSAVISFAILGGLTLVGLSLIYRYGPSRDTAELSWVTPGAVVATILWFVGSAGFAFYVGNFGSYNETFGAVAGVVVLMMWLWISAYVIMLGAELNAEMEAQTRHDSTVGRDEPMGTRGAEKADHLGAAHGSGTA